MAKQRTRKVKPQSSSVSAKEVPGSRSDYESSGTVTQAEPKIQTYPPMYKDAGAGVIKFFKVVAVRTVSDKSYIRTKSGKFGLPLSTDEKKCVSFNDACEQAQRIIAEKSRRGYKPK
jgi:hypothetical protein